MRKAMGSPDSPAPDDGLDRFANPAYGGMDLVLKATWRGDAPKLQLLTASEAWTPEHLEQLGEAVGEVLSAAVEDPSQSLGNVRPPKPSGRSLAALQFHF